MNDKNKKQPLKTIKSSMIARGLSLTKLMVSSGARIASAKVQEAVGSNNVMSQVLKANAESIVSELGKLKGSAMKAGQSLAMISEHFFPKEITDILAKLNEKSEEVAWETIHKSLLKSLGKQKLNQLEIEETAFASASLGQVHRARIKASGEDVCMKIQYPGVADSIDSDLATIKTLFHVSKMIPQYGHKIDAIFAEIKTMLKQETDYLQEALSQQEFQKLLNNDSCFIVPKIFSEFSNDVVITSSFEAGVPFNDPQVVALDRSRRSRIAQAYAELFLKELLEFGFLQTDPHFGNYKVRIDPNGQSDQLVLLDFGAMRRFSKSFLNPYTDLIIGSMERNEDLILKAAYALDFLRQDDSLECKRLFIELCILIIEPWMRVDAPRTHPDFFTAHGYYDWFESDLPHRLKAEIARFSVAYKFRPPPGEVVFLDRRLAGVFTGLKALDAPFDAHALIKRYLVTTPQ